jgi:DNA-binding transcriptional ArsR family regulator
MSAPLEPGDVAAEANATSTTKSESPDGGIASLDALDPLLQHRSRLGAMVLLSTSELLSFRQLRVALQETDGNLGAQLRKLEEAGYIDVQKAFVDRKPSTTYRISNRGISALKKHLAAMSSLVATVNGSNNGRPT